MTIKLNQQEAQGIARQYAIAIKRNMERLGDDLKEAEQMAKEAQGDRGRTMVLLARIERIKAEIDRYTNQQEGINKIN